MASTSVSNECKPLRDYASVLQAIKSLPAPAPGRVRVFRGQTVDHPKMLASAFRVKSKTLNSPLFDLSTRVVAQDLLGQININLELDMMLFWLQAVAQHYGPGSSYLDVTHSLDVALWFALHESQTHEVKMVHGPGVAPDPKNDILRVESWLGFGRWEKTGYLYVFDVRKWRIEEEVGHGDLIDLAEAPPVFFSSRMRVQSGCLLTSGPNPRKTDLRDCLAGTPIAVAWPMTGASGFNRATEDMFPGPQQDNWYKRFLSIPLVPQPDATTEEITMGHPLPLTIYLPDQQKRAREVMRCTNGLLPALMYSSIGDQTLDLYDPGSQKYVKQHLRDATILILESPLRFFTPPANYDGWNQGLLCSDISDSICAFDASDQRAGWADLRNVFVEFSPLDSPELSRPEDSCSGWLKRLVKGQRVPAIVLRAVWLVRSGTQLSVSVYYQNLTNNQVTTIQMGRIALDSSTGTIRYGLTPQNPSASQSQTYWKDLAEFTTLTKPVFTVLYVLRELSPILKAAPFPEIVTDAGTDNQKMLVRVSKESARLLRVKDSRTSQLLHFVRGLELSESFLPEGRGGAFEFKVNMPFSKLDPAWIRRKIAVNAARFDSKGTASGRWRQR
jgi:FRG domain